MTTIATPHQTLNPNMAEGNRSRSRSSLSKMTEGEMVVCLVLGFPLLIILILLSPFIYYVDLQMCSYRKYKKLLEHGIENPEQNGPAVVAKIVNKPPEIRWTVTCNRHRGGTRSNSRQQYDVTEPWPNTEESWTVNTTRSCPRTIFEEPFVLMSVRVIATYNFANFPPELKQKEQELLEQHSECDADKFSVKRQAETIYRSFIVKEGCSLEWSPFKYWMSSIFACGYCTENLDKHVVYTVEKVNTGSTISGNQAVGNSGPGVAGGLDAGAVTVHGFQGDLPPSYDTLVTEPDKYNPPTSKMQPSHTHSNKGNHSNSDISVQLPNYSEYTRSMDQPAVHVHSDLTSPQVSYVSGDSNRPQPEVNPGYISHL